jgi:glycosyltransferase involved in cell wall biosynthesis
MESLTFYTDVLKQFIENLKVPKLENSKAFPKLSIITPSYNQGKYLERTILSVLNQGYPNLEYIIIDGGSEDNSVEIIKRYEKYIAFWVSEKDKGQVDALNKGFRIATGDWLGFQNSDDVYFPGTLPYFGQVVTENPSYDIVYGDLFIIDQEDTVTELLKTVPYNLNSQLIEGMQIHNQSLFFKKELLEKYGMLSTKYQFAFDYEFVTRFTLDRVIKVKRVNQLSGALRVHQEAKSSTIAELGRKEHSEIQEAYFKEAWIQVINATVV